MDGIGSMKTHAAAFAMRLDGHAHVFKQAPHGRDIAQAGHVRELDGLIGQQGGTHLGQGGILGPGNVDGAMQGAAAPDQEFVHTRRFLCWFY